MGQFFLLYVGGEKTELFTRRECPGADVISFYGARPLPGHREDLSEPAGRQLHATGRAQLTPVTSQGLTPKAGQGPTLLGEINRQR